MLAKEAVQPRLHTIREGLTFASQGYAECIKFGAAGRSFDELARAIGRREPERRADSSLAPCCSANSPL
jgi:hypothetical protein